MDYDVQEKIRRDAHTLISEKMEQMKHLIRECETIATVHGVDFHLTLEGLDTVVWNSQSQHWQSSNC